MGQGRVDEGSGVALEKPGEARSYAEDSRAGISRGLRMKAVRLCRHGAGIERLRQAKRMTTERIAYARRP